MGRHLLSREHSLNSIAKPYCTMIDSPSNPLVKELQALQTPKGRGEQGRFLVEGVRLVSDALDAGWSPRVLLYNHEALRRTEMGTALLYRLRSPQLQDDLRGMSQEASERAIAAAANTQHPQGVVASLDIRKWERPQVGSSSRLALVCDTVQDPGNLGTMLRTAEAAGVSLVLLTPDCADLYNPKVVRAGMGAHFRLPTFADLAWPDVVSQLTELGIAQGRIFATDAAAGQTYDSVDWTAPSALIVSNEAHGPSEGARSSAGEWLSIPMLGGTESLNAAMAAAVLLFEAARQRRTSHHA